MRWSDRNVPVTAFRRHSRSRSIVLDWKVSALNNTGAVFSIADIATTIYNKHAQFVYKITEKNDGLASNILNSM